MRPWLEEQINSNTIPGLKWLNKVSALGTCACACPCVCERERERVPAKCMATKSKVFLCVQNFIFTHYKNEPTRNVHKASGDHIKMTSSSLLPELRVSARLWDLE